MSVFEALMFSVAFATLLFAVVSLIVNLITLLENRDNRSKGKE